MKVSHHFPCLHLTSSYPRFHTVTEMGPNKRSDGRDIWALWLLFLLSPWVRTAVLSLKPRFNLGGTCLFSLVSFWLLNVICFINFLLQTELDVFIPLCSGGMFLSSCENVLSSPRRMYSKHTTGWRLPGLVCRNVLRERSIFMGTRDREICNGTIGYFEPSVGRGHQLSWLSVDSVGPQLISV